LKVVSDEVAGADAETLTDLYNKNRKHPLSVSRIRQWLKRLEDIGWVDIREATHENYKGFIDIRYNSYTPLKKKKYSNYIYFWNHYVFKGDS
jgi:hypothetical protein